MGAWRSERRRTGEGARAPKGPFCPAGIGDCVRGRSRGENSRSGLIIPLVILALVLFGLFAFTLIQSSQGEYRLTQKTVDLERAKMLARSGLAHASALIFQNPFEERWYKQNQGPHGYFGVLEGKLGEGTPEEGSYKVVAEDIANELPSGWEGSDSSAKAKRLEGLKYNRIDLFSEGIFRDTRVILYQALVLYPEEKVYAYEKESSSGMIFYRNVRVR